MGLIVIAVVGYGFYDDWQIEKNLAEQYTRLTAEPPSPPHETRAPSTTLDEEWMKIGGAIWERSGMSKNSERCIFNYVYTGTPTMICFDVTDRRGRLSSNCINATRSVSYQYTFSDNYLIGSSVYEPQCDLTI